VSARSGSNINNLFYKDIFSQISKKYKLLGEEVNDNGEQNQNKSKIFILNVVELKPDQKNMANINKKKCC